MQNGLAKQFCRALCKEGEGGQTEEKMCARPLRLDRPASELCCEAGREKRGMEDASWQICCGTQTVERLIDDLEFDALLR